jgi:hypothetical protein
MMVTKGIRCINCDYGTCANGVCTGGAFFRVDQPYTGAAWLFNWCVGCLLFVLRCKQLCTALVHARMLRHPAVDRPIGRLQQCVNAINSRVWLSVTSGCTCAPGCVLHRLDQDGSVVRQVAPSKPAGPYLITSYPDWWQLDAVNSWKEPKFGESRCVEGSLCGVCAAGS